MAVTHTSLCRLLGVDHPIMLAGMGSVSGPDLAAAVSNAGGVGTLGGANWTPEVLRKEIAEMKKQFTRPGLPFGVDLLIPQVGGSARKTNKDYTKGKLDELIDIIIEEKTTVFICAVGIPPARVVEKLHAAGIVCANMVGAPHHVKKALDVGADIVIAQGTEAGGHTGDVATFPLIPQCVDLCKGRTNHFGSDVLVVAAGGIYDGRGLAAALCLGAAGVWVGTRFIACEESNGSAHHAKNVVNAESIDTTRTEAFTGRPCRLARNSYIKSWESRPGELKEMLSQGRIPFMEDVENGAARVSHFFPSLMGQVAGAIKDIKPARAIVEGMVQDAERVFANCGMSPAVSKL